MARFLSKIAGRYILLTVVLAAIWLLLSGIYDHPVLWVFGCLSIALVIGLSAMAGVADQEGVPTAVFPGIIGYMLWLTLEIGKANLIVAWHVLTLRLSPQMIDVPTTQKTDLARVILANSITLTPGTVCVDLQKDTVLVHALTQGLADMEALAIMDANVAKIDRGSAL